MPVLIMMNKPYDDDEALETVVSYILRSGYGYCGGYGVDINYPVQQMQQVKVLWAKTVVVGCAILFYLSVGMRRSVMCRPCAWGLKSAGIIVIISLSMVFIQIRTTSICTLQSILSPTKLVGCMRKERRTGMD